MGSTGSAIATSTVTIGATTTIANQSKRSVTKKEPTTPRSMLRAVDSFGNSSFDSALDSPTIYGNQGILSKFSFLIKSNSQNETTIKEPLTFDS